MPIDTYQKPNDYDISRFTDTEPTADGAVHIPPKNRIPSQFLTELESDGAPAGWTRNPGPEDGGFHAYLSRTDGDRSTLSRQTLDAIRAEEDAFQFSKPVIGGAPAPAKDTPLVAELAQPLESATVAAVPSDEVGFPEGQYLAAISYVTKGNKHTRTTEPVLLEVTTTGQLLEFKLFTDLPPGAEGQGLWLSLPVPLASSTGPSETTMRLQEVVRHKRRTHILPGPYRWHGRKRPSKNETKVGVPKVLNRGRDFELRGGAAAKSLQPHDYKFFWTQVTQGGGESKPSGGTPWYAVENDRPGIAWVFHPKTFHPDAIGYKLYCYLDNKPNPEVYQLVYGRNANKTRHIPRRHGRGEAPRLYGYRDNGQGSVRADVPDTRLTADISASAGTITVDARVGFPRHRGFYIRVEKEKMYVYAGFRSKTWSVKRHRDKTKAKKHSNNTSVVLDKGDPLVHPYSIEALLVPSEMPTEDTSGIEDPEGEIDAPVALGSGRPPAGTYWVTYTRVLDGRETVAARPKRVTIGANEVIEMRFPERVNRLPNALYGNFNQKGLPSRWQMFRPTPGNNADLYLTTQGDSTINVNEAGVVRLNTGGLISDTNRTPRAVLGRLTSNANTEVVLPIYPGKVETFSGVLEVSNYNGTGRGFIEVVQYDEGLVELASINVARATVDSSTSFEFKFGGTEISSQVDKVWASNAVYFAIRWGAENGSNSSRNLTVAAHSLIWFPGEGAPRRFNVPTAETDVWEATIDPAAAYHSGHVLAIGPPPPTPATPVSRGPIDVVDHTNGTISYGTATPQGKFPAGWSTIRNSAGVPDADTTLLTHDIVNDTTFGVLGHSLKVESTNTASFNQLSVQKTFTNTEVKGTSLAVTADIKVGQQPTTQNSSVDLLTIMTPENDRNLARVRLKWAAAATVDTEARYSVYLVYTNGPGNTTGTDTEEWVGAGSRGDTFTIEIAVAGGNSTEGSVSCSMGLSNSRRNVRFARGGLNWTGRMPRKVKYGGFNESTANTRWRFWFDNVYVTPYGRPLSVVTPAETQIPEPDIPLKKGDTIAANGVTPIVYEDPGTTRTQLALAANANRGTNTVSTERTIVQITDKSNNELASIRCASTGHDIYFHAPGQTPRLIVDNFPTSRTDRFEVVVRGGGTNAGEALAYWTGPGGVRKLMGQFGGLDYTTLFALRSQIPTAAEFTRTNIQTSERGEQEYDSTDPNGLPINQGYVFMNPHDALLDDEVGWEVDEGYVTPDITNTYAVLMKARNVPAGSAPLALVCYNEEGREWYAGDPLNNALTDSTDSNKIGYKNNTPGWREYVFNFSPPAGYFRYRVVNRFVTGGSWTFQGLLVTPGNMIANSDSGAKNRRDARTDSRLLTGQAVFSLMARVPGQDSTPMQGQYGEERSSLDVQLENASGQEYNFTTSGTSTISAPGHRYVVGSAVKFTGDPTTEELPAEINEVSTYYVVSADQTLGTFTVSLTPGGSAISSISATGSTMAPTVSGYGFASNIEYRANPDDSDVLPDSTDSAWTSWTTDLTTVPDYKHIEVRVTLYGDSVISPIIPAGGVKLFYVCRNAPMLLRDDRSPLPGGTVVGVGGTNLGRPYNLPVYDTEAPGDKAVPRAITRDVGRLDGFPVWVFTEDAMDELRESQLDADWVIESPFWNMVMTARFYEPSEFSPQQEVEFQDERLNFFMPRRMDISRSEVIESGPLDDA